MTLQLNELSDDFEMSSAPVGLVNIAARSGLYRNYVKRLFDVAAVVASGLVVGPLILFLALLVAADGSNPFYWNERVGRRGGRCGGRKDRGDEYRAPAS